jgi:peptidoglycan/xylan/chitin deacetylase (PgdA/CDA1 family)
MRLYRSPRLLRWLFPFAIWKGADKRSVYLTFDDGPSKELTPWLLETLKKAEIKATFFCVGNNVKNHPELYRQIISEGHRVGNHTMHHENGLKTTSADYLRSVKEAQKQIDSELFRPPYGKLSIKQYFQIKRLHMKVVFWSWLSYDFDPTQSVDELKKNLHTIKGGDILVFHDNPKAANTLIESLQYVIDFLDKKSFTIKTI